VRAGVALTKEEAKVAAAAAASRCARQIEHPRRDNIITGHAVLWGVRACVRACIRYDMRATSRRSTQASAAVQYRRRDRYSIEPGLRFSILDSRFGSASPD